MTTSDSSFSYRAVDADGGSRSGSITAPSKAEALRRLSRDGLTVINLQAQSASETSAKSRSSRITTAERVLALRQLALLSKAGIELLSSLETVAGGMEGRLGTQLRSVASLLRKGKPISSAFVEGAPGFPEHIYALIGAGDATGSLPKVLADAADLLAFEDRIRRDIVSSLTYPAFLLSAGAAAVAFLFYEVVPRFSQMIGENRQQLEGLSGWVLGAGEFFRANALIIGGGLLLTALVISAALSQEAGRRAGYSLLGSLPIIGRFIRSRERALWARIMGFSLGSGVPILQAGDLAARAVPESPLRKNLMAATRSIRSGKSIEIAYLDTGILDKIDRSLVRAGQESGQLAAMFGYMAERHEENLRDDLKRVIALVEPIAISLVALAIGTVAIGLVTAMSSVYDSIG